MTNHFTRRFMNSTLWILTSFASFALTACAPAGSSPDRGVAGFENCSLSFVDSNACAEIYWEDKPTAENPQGTFVVEFFSPNDRSAFLDPNDLEVTLSSPNKTYNAPLRFDKLRTGQYRVANVTFPSPGTWIITLSVKQGSQTVDQASFEYQF